ncbi:hypothetical protein BJX76DRAFT_317450 [Aspergillus varians]
MRLSSGDRLGKIADRLLHLSLNSNFSKMAARLSRCLLQSNRLLFAGRGLPRLASFMAGHSGVRNTPRWTYRATQPKIARSSHTNSSSSLPAPSSINLMGVQEISAFTKTHWASQEFPIVDPLIEPQTMTHFMGSITYGVLPNGKRADFPLLLPGEPFLFLRPPSEWAPAPFSASTLPPMHQISTHINHLENPALDTLALVGANINLFKNRLWEGHVPLSETRWLEKGLNNPNRFDVAVEYLTAVIAVFEYLNIPQIRSNLRATFNLISDSLQDMEHALNARRKIQHPGHPDLNLTAMWEEFIRAKYEAMTSTAHSWILSRITELKNRALDGTPVPSSPPEEVSRFAKRWQDLEAITGMADVYIWMSMDGYKGYQPPSEVIGGLHNSELENLEKTYETRFNDIALARMRECSKAQGEAAQIHPSVKQIRERFSTSITVQDELRKEIRGPLPSVPTVEPWIELLLRSYAKIHKMPSQKRGDYGFELAIYRAAYEFSDEEWETLRAKLERHLSAWGDGVRCAEEVKPLLKLHWFDCRELGLETIDAAAAKRHFQQIRDLDAYANKLDHHVLLVVDGWSAHSYKMSDVDSKFTEDKTLLPGDDQAHILAVDADFEIDTDASTASTSDEESSLPEYNGQVRILGNLVWSDLYPLVTMQPMHLQSLWLMARENPTKLYTGLPVPSQVTEWRERNTLKAAMMSSFTKFLEKRDPKAAKVYKEYKKTHDFIS